MAYRCTYVIKEPDWSLVFRLYEHLYDCRIDSEVPQGWWDNNREEIVRRLGACMVYERGCVIGGKHMFRDEILSGIGITLNYEKVEE